MIVLIWLGIGALAGWLACVVAHTHGRLNCMLNIGVGVGGSFLAGMLVPMLNNSEPLSSEGPTMGGVLACFCFAWMLLALIASLQPVWRLDRSRRRIIYKGSRA